MGFRFVCVNRCHIVFERAANRTSLSSSQTQILTSSCPLNGNVRGDGTQFAVWCYARWSRRVYSQRYRARAIRIDIYCELIFTHFCVLSSSVFSLNASLGLRGFGELCCYTHLVCRHSRRLDWMDIGCRFIVCRPMVGRSINCVWCVCVDCDLIWCWQHIGVFVSGARMIMALLSS